MLTVLFRLYDMASLLDWDLEAQVYPIVRWLVLHRRAKIVDTVHNGLKTVFTIAPKFETRCVVSPPSGLAGVMAHLPQSLRFDPGLQAGLSPAGRHAAGEDPLNDIDIDVQAERQSFLRRGCQVQRPGGSLS